MGKVLNVFLASLACVIASLSVASTHMSFTEHTIADDVVLANTVYTKDINGDGYVDIVSAAGSGTSDAGEVSWWKNDGNQNFTKYTIRQDARGARSVLAEDMNGDGEIDIVAAVWTENKILMWINDGQENFAQNECIIDSTFVGPHTVDAKDVNADGHMDVLCSGFDLYGHEGEIAWWEHDGNEGFTKHLISDRFQQSPFIFGEYINHDEHMDILACGELNGEVLWWENDGSQSFIEHMIDSTYTYAHTVFARDVDGDGDMDILGAACISSQFTWWENDGDEHFEKHHIENVNGALWIDAVDLDGDGDNDLIGAGMGEDNIAWWENDGSQHFTRQAIEGYFPGAFGVVWADMDSDGDVDLVGAGRSCNRISWWENDLYTFRFMAEPTTGHAPLAVQFTDMSIASAPITLWAWDFDTDGVLDSDQHHPIWTYDQPGIYTVSLEVSGESLSYAMMVEDCIHVFDGESALLFNGENSYVSCPATPILNLTHGFTIEAWINPFDWGAFSPFGLGKIADKRNISLCLIDAYPPFADHSLRLQLMHTDGTASCSNTPQQSIVLNEWQHVAATYNGEDGVRMYVNGIEQTVTHTTPPSGSIKDNSDDDLIIGNSADRGATFDGIIDEVRIWNAARTGEDIQGNMNVLLCGNEPGLIGNWHMNEGNGEAILDNSGNGNDGDVVDALWREGVHLDSPSVDSDEDGIVDCSDNCPDEYNPEQEDEDADGLGDVCDNCPEHVNPDQGDADSDGTGDVCDSCTDTDGDGYGDPGYPANTCDEDNCPNVSNPDQAPVERGDINCEDGINVLDVLAVVNHILGKALLIGSPLDRADCNGDARVNILDALGIINVILGIAECQPAASRPLLTPEVMQFCESLKQYLASEDFAQFMTLVKSEGELPAEYRLSQNYPNPFNSSTSIQYSVISDQSPSHVTLKIYSILGEEVRTVVDEVMKRGHYTVTWDGKDENGREVSSGVYFYRFAAGHVTAAKRMLLVK